MPNDNKGLFLLKKRTVSEKLIDKGFRSFSLLMASAVAIVLFSIFLVVFYESLDSIDRYGLNFLTTSEWNPVTD